MMDFGPNRDGVIAPDQVVAYKRFGDWIRRCYGAAVAYASGSVAVNGTLVVQIPQNGTVVDRVVMREDQTNGQIIREYEVEAAFPNGSWARVSSGQSIGNKRIDFFNVSLKQVRSLRLRITAVAPGLASGKVKHFGAYMECMDDAEA